MSGREGDFPWGVWKPETEFSLPLGFWIAVVGLGVYICVCVCSYARVQSCGSRKHQAFFSL